MKIYLTSVRVDQGNLRNHDISQAECSRQIGGKIQMKYIDKIELIGTKDMITSCEKNEMKYLEKRITTYHMKCSRET